MAKLTAKNSEFVPYNLARPKRVAVYLRVSTRRQASADVSLPSQKRLIDEHCNREGWIIADTYVERGRTATDDRRPEFRKLLDRAADSDRPYDLIVVHALHRFFRDGAVLEITLRDLRRRGVRLVSITQPIADDPAGRMTRQILGLIDQYSSEENGRQVKRVMVENAKQGFWNGATAPLGYRRFDAEQRGEKIKKKIEIDPVEAEVVRLIFRLYLDGDAATGTPPLGIKKIASWLNSKGYRTRRGGMFGVAGVYLILKNTAYIGACRYNVRDSKTGDKYPEEDVVKIPVPLIVSQEIFDAVKTKLAASNPKVVSPRLMAGPILLTGIAKCAYCSGGMTQRTGTSSTGRVYSYYTCAARAQKGPSACGGNTVRMAYLDDIVLTALEDRLFAPERLAEVLNALAARQSARSETINARLVGLQTEMNKSESALKRLYKLVEEGHVEIDDLLSDRIALLKADRENARAALDRARAQARPFESIAAEKVEAFGRLMRSVLRDSDTPARKAYLRALINSVEVGDGKVRILASTDVLQAAAAAPADSAEDVRGSVLKWRARNDSNVRPSDS